MKLKIENFTKKMITSFQQNGYLDFLETHNLVGRVILHHELVNGVLLDVNTLIPANSDLFLFEAVDINSREQIVGTAFQISTARFTRFWRLR